MLWFGGCLLSFHLASDWSQNNKHFGNFLSCSQFYGKDCNCFGHPNNVDCIMKDWWWMTSLQEQLNTLCLKFILLSRRLHCFKSFGLFVFCWKKLLTTSETTAVTWSSTIWHFLAWHYDPIRNWDSFFALACGQLHWATGWGGNVKARSKCGKKLESNLFLIP